MTRIHAGGLPALTVHGGCLWEPDALGSGGREYRGGLVSRPKSGKRRPKGPRQPGQG
jgi:hypothetical protein